MGSELTCTARYQKQASSGKAHLEGETISFRGADLRFTIPFNSISSAEVRKGHLVLTTADGVAVLELGDKAETWARKITSPKSLPQKLGIRDGLTLRFIGQVPEGFDPEARAAGGQIVAEAEPADLTFLFAGDKADLLRVKTLVKKLKPGEVLWVVRPKGSRDISEMDVLNSGRATGLTDVKVVKFSEGLTAAKFVQRKKS